MIKETLKCRFCGEPLQHSFADLGVQPFCETYLGVSEQNKLEPFYLLRVYFCDNCLLVQLEESMSPKELFTNYAYYSSQSKGWLKHVESYAEMISAKLNLNEKSLVVEIGSNDGYLLQYFAQRGVQVMGVEPASNVAQEAQSKGIPTIIKFFDKELSDVLVGQNKRADLLIGNNILAQVPDLNGFIESVKNLLKPTGVITMEFHHLMKLIDNNQFDTISHERFSYLSFTVVEKIFTSHGLTIFDVEEIPTHGGSLRIYARHAEDESKPITHNVPELRSKEKDNGLNEAEKYSSFNQKVKKTKRAILTCLIELKNSGKSIVGYGAHAEANTLLNYCGIRLDFLDYTADRNPFKQGKFLGGTRIPVFHPDKIKESKPDYIFVLPWSIKREIMEQLSYIAEWDGKFIVPIPEVTVYNSKGTQISSDALSLGGK
jgi:cyclopropane fatty-acyl-phospholipid synthase-like methyltransferase